MKMIQQLLTSLTDVERDYIAGLDYGADRDQHRKALDKIISEGGLVDLQSVGYWFPYEVIELGKSHLEKGHEREFAACAGIVLLNIASGGDTSNDIDNFIYGAVMQELPEDLRLILEILAEKAGKKRRQGTPLDAEPAARGRRN